ncbi:MAG: Ig-like domain-containing protein [Flavobacterium sp.]|nr:Ig-like domain-containing protein [Pedobacter sp.]
MKVLRLIIFLFFIVFQSTSLFSQDTVGLNTIIEKTHIVNQENPIEKVYLHFDKPYYAIGDTIWFKGYLAINQNQPSDLSKVLYVDIITDKDSIVNSIKLPVSNTSAYGSVTLDPLKYKAGNYRFRAYTYWMMNRGESSFFYKNIIIGDALSRKVITNISLKTEDAGPMPNINSTISYKDRNGIPFANRKVSWKVTSNFQTLAKGKEITNERGIVSITIGSKQKKDLDAGVLETVLEDVETGKITSTFFLGGLFKEADIQFFPEGGELIENVSGYVAFKAIQENGLGLNVRGEITDDAGAVISKIESANFGMGKFLFKPESGRKYTANLTFANGIKKSVALPATKTSGITLSVINNNSANLNLRVSSNSKYYSSIQNKTYYIIAQSKGAICYAAKTTLNQEVFSALIPKNKFPPGIAQLTLFSSFGEPLSERLIFINQAEVLNLTATTDKKSYRIRQAVKMSVNAKTASAPIEGNFSVSVINEDKVPFDENNETTILSSFLLSSELIGYIEKPNYYFNQVNEKKLADLDLLMLTQGYRKFSFQDILKDKIPAISFLPEQGITYKGTLRSSNGMPVSKGRLRLEVLQNRFVAETVSNIKGQFEFQNVKVPDSSAISISAGNATGAKNMMIMLDGSAFPEVSKNVNAADEKLNIDSALSPYLLNSKRQYRLSSQTLEEVVIQSTALAKPSHADYASLSGLSMPDHTLNSDRFKGCNVLLNCLQSSAPGLMYIDNNFFVTRVYNSGLKLPVQIFFNGSPVDASYLSSIAPADVESVEIFLKDESGIVNRLNNTNGVLVINSKKKVKSTVTAEDLKALFPPNNVLTFNSFGFVKTREFYLPKYNTPASRSVGSDLRSTIYWNPKIFTDKNGNMSFDFFNGDNKGNYKATVEGTDIDGNLARFIYRYKVE